MVCLKGYKYVKKGHWQNFAMKLRVYILRHNQFWILKPV